MKYASEDLMNEHEGILFGLTILERMIRLLEENQPANIEDLQEMINFFKLFVDKCHHGKEENLLFPAMEKAGIPKENGPIGQMLLEHEEGRNYVARMSGAFRSDGMDRQDFIQGASAYILLLRAHINKENTVLFPLGDKMIPAKQQAELLERFEDYEETVMGTGTHERLHETLHRFEQKYLERV